MDLLKAYDDLEEKLPGLTRVVVEGFNEYVKNSTPGEYYMLIDEYIDSLHYSIRTKRVYKTKLRRFIETITE